MSVISPGSPTLYNFDSDELQRALEEQSFGIAGFELLSSTSSLESSALVTLLEGDVVTISVSSRGYQLLKNPGCASSPTQTGKIYEAIETLLQTVSPLYEGKRRDNLVAQLERLS